jgi:hypothetical protein
VTEKQEKYLIGASSFAVGFIVIYLSLNLGFSNFEEEQKNTPSAASLREAAHVLEEE